MTSTVTDGEDSSLQVFVLFLLEVLVQPHPPMILLVLLLFFALAGPRGWFTFY